MLTYLRNLQTERDSLTAAATTMAETAARETRDLTETEQASLATMQERCATIDTQLTTYSAQRESQRAYAQLRAALQDDDAGDTGEGGQGGNVHNGQANPERRDAEPANARWGATFVQSASFRSYTGHGTSAPIELPLELRAAADPITSASLLTQPYVHTQTPPTFNTPLLDLVAKERVTNGSVQWLYWTTRDPEAGGPVAEGAVKPPADMPAEVRDTSLETYAHYKTITRQALDDIPRIQSIVETKLRNGLARRLDTEVGNALAGDPTIPTVAGDTLLAAIRAAMAQGQAAGYTPSAIALNPNDWAALDVALLGATLNGPVVGRTFWGLTPVAAPSVEEGTAYVGDFNAAVTVFDRGVANVFLTDSHADLFVRNTLLLLAETRAKVVVTEPYALLKATGDAAPPGGSDAPPVVAPTAPTAPTAP